MKKIQLLFVLISISCLGQKPVTYTGFESATHHPELTELQKLWQINILLTTKEVNEYYLTPTDPKNTFVYGNGIQFKPDGTFVSKYSAPCGNDCFTASIGKYKLVNNDYICFFLENVSHSGECKAPSTAPNEDLGLFRIYRNATGISFFKSDGNPLNDVKKQQYIELLTQKQKEIFSYVAIEYNLKWIATERVPEESELVKQCMTQNQISNYTLLYSKVFGATTVVLTQVNNKYYYLLYQYLSDKEVKIALFDERQCGITDLYIHQIDSDHSLTLTTLQEPYYHGYNELSKNTIEILKKGDAIKKITYYLYQKQLSATIIFYFKEEEPLYAYEKFIYTYTPEKKVTELVSYISDWKKGLALTKMIEVNGGWSFSGMQELYYHLIDAIKKQN